ncbi:ABC transporter substrate-binding protein [Solicola sp. PLA-1-18]|uniref:ABC transporter substrate-binding protein n=1 Tax=Solicola sp. PLA-1-18 TaxID=3380532 RepID=UPI003B78F4CC
MSRRPLTLIGAALAVGLTLTACGGGGGDDAFSSGDSGGGGSITLGSANFPENELLMNMYAGALEAKGVDVSTQPNIGSREIYIKALEDGSIDAVPEYNGALLAFLKPDGVPDTVSSPEQVETELKKVLPEGTEILAQSDAEDKDAVTVTKATADKYSLKSIADLEPVAGDLVAGGSPEWQTRYQGLKGLKSVYGLTFKSYRPLDVGGPLTISALKDGTIDVADVFSTDSAFTTEDFVALEDPENLFTSQNIVPLIKSDKVTPEVTEALDGVSKALTTENLTEALAKVQVDKADPKTVADEFLKDNNLD